MVSSYFRFKRGVIDAIEFLLAAIYAIVSVLIRKKKRRVIIYYHGVRNIELPGFERQISHLNERYQVLGLTELMRTSHNRKEKLVAITFDDGFMSVVENAWPVLKKYDLKAAMFTPVGNLGQRPQWPIAGPWRYDRKERVLSHEMVRELDSEGFEMLSHTVSHTVLTELAADRLEVELVQSRQKLEEIVGHEVVSISYPLGKYNEKVVTQAKHAGYQYGFTIEPFTVDDSASEMEIGRFVVNPNMSMLKFRLKASGAYQVTSFLRRIKAWLLCNPKGE